MRESTSESIRRKRIGGIFAALLLVAVLGGLASSIYQSGWSQGYLFGVLASGEGGSALLAPYALHSRGALGFLGGIGAIFKFGLVALFLLFIAKMMRCWMGAKSESWGGTWQRRWHEHDDAPHADADPAPGGAGESSATTKTVYEL